MRLSAVCFIVMSAVAFAGHASLDEGPVSSDGYWLEYDDGTPGWYSWNGTYRGVWFDIQDFVPGANAWFLTQSEFWFYHEETSHTWDTSDFFAELWNGDVNGPVTKLDQQIVTALDYAPVYADYSSLTERHFWAVVNVDMSNGGWPSILLDNQDSSVSHSFLSDDYIDWTPYTLTSGKIINFLIAVQWEQGPAIERLTWGSLKATF